MSATFWTNKIWYVLLGILTIIELTYIMVKTERRSLTFAFFLSILGIVLRLYSSFMRFIILVIDWVWS